jgi:hypothetical protein
MSVMMIKKKRRKVEFVTPGHGTTSQASLVCSKTKSGWFFSCFANFIEWNPLKFKCRRRVVSK